MIKEVLLTTLTGMGVGAVFSIFKLPVPAPPVFAGLMGIFGLWMGYGLVQRVLS
jgi:XapX domain-containing protein